MVVEVVEYLVVFLLPDRNLVVVELEASMVVF